jgi:membrane dipeptidase
MRKMPGFLLAVVVVVALPLFISGDEISDGIMGLHRAAVVFDAHCDTAMRLIGEDRIDLGDRHESGHIDLPRMKEGGLDAQIFACWLSPSLPEKVWIRRTLRMIDGMWNQAQKHPDRLEIALKGSDVRRIVSEGKAVAVLGIEGGHAIMDDLGVLRTYYRLGVRCMTLTWMNTNNWADSSDDTTRWGGLNELGRDVVREMDRLGMVIDCSHVSDSTFFDVLDVTKNPVLISHSCVRALCDVPRNVSDDELRALKRNGGVICINYFAGFISKDYYEKVTALWDQFEAERRELAEQYGGDEEKAGRELYGRLREKVQTIPKPTISDLVDHIDYAVSIAGVEHVGLGSDFDGITSAPRELDDVSKLPLITEELARRGYSDKDMEKILGGNLLRLVERVCR